VIDVIGRLFLNTAWSNPFPVEVYVPEDAVEDQVLSPEPVDDDDPELVLPPLPPSPPPPPGGTYPPTGEIRRSAVIMAAAKNIIPEYCRCFMSIWNLSEVIIKYYVFF
jgi:hypothetical protein